MSDLCPFASFFSYMETLIIIESHAAGKIVWILISWLLQKPADLNLYHFQKRTGLGKSNRPLAMASALCCRKSRYFNCFQCKLLNVPINTAM